MPKLTRREFIPLAVAGSVSLCHDAQAVQPRSSAMLTPIIDTHQHLWDLTKISPPWLKNASEKISASHTMEDYKQAIEGLNIVQAVYMEVDVAPEQMQKEAELVRKLIQDKAGPTTAAVVSADPVSPDFQKLVGPWSQWPEIRGIRRVLHGGTPAGHCLRPEFVRSMQYLGEVGLSFDLCMRAGELKDGAELAKKCPETRFIVDHLGNGDPKAFLPAGDPRHAKAEHKPKVWQEGIRALADQANTICKISGIAARVPKDWTPDELRPVIHECIKRFGPDRIVFGSDWPVCKLGASLKEWVTALRTILEDFPEETRDKLLYANAQRLYRLEPVGG
ncbi:MAG: amidohydrolase family protein [Pirellulaceae bacterium]